LFARKYIAYTNTLVSNTTPNDVRLFDSRENSAPPRFWLVLLPAKYMVYGLLLVILED